MAKYSETELTFCAQKVEWMLEKLLREYLVVVATQRSRMYYQAAAFSHRPDAVYNRKGAELKGLDGFLCIDKPRGPSSFQIVNRIRHPCLYPRLACRTLDPQASGVLVVALGFATRLLRFIHSEPKVYSFKVQFGSQTDTLDSEGKLIHSGGRIPDRLEIEEIIGEFTGEQMQVPPDFSAVKVNGVRAYKLARDGKKAALRRA